MPSLASQPVQTGFQIPDVMDWTILPASITAQAWTDPEFRGELLADPTATLRQRIKRWPRDKTFSLDADSELKRFFVLPVRKRAFEGLSRAGLYALLRHELGDDDSFEFHLPPAVIAAALADDALKNDLLRDGAATLQSLGYEPRAPLIVVLENSPSHYHLVLPCNPSRVEDLDFDALHASLRERFGANTTRCCASGTCT
jgi:hypothetical protein